MSLGEKVFIPIKKDTAQEFESINGNFFVHKVERGRTLYSLAKEFNLQQKDIIALNPDIDETGIKEGQEIKIPVKEIKQQKPAEEVAKTNTTYQTHTVKSGETLYSLSKLYKVSIDSIKLVNNGLAEGLKVDQQIFLPIVASPNLIKPTKSPIQLNSNLETIQKNTTYLLMLLKRKMLL